MINKNLEELLDMHPAFALVKNYVAGLDASTLPGRYEIDGDKICALVSRYITKREREVFMESHREHSEIHYLITGEEEIGFADVKDLELYSPYSAERDIEFWHRPFSYARARIDNKKAVFINCGEGHAPQISIVRPQEVIKVVIKFKKSVIESL